jgi:hypothetical protein
LHRDDRAGERRAGDQRIRYPISKKPHRANVCLVR